MRYLDVAAAKKISKIGLGTHQFGSPEWGYGDWYASKEARAIVRRALELGITLFDTAEIYGYRAHRFARRALRSGIALSDTAKIEGFGRSERILGRALGDDREAAFVATKFYPAVPAVPVVERHALASANRLGTHRLDLYQVHEPGRLIPGAAVMRGLCALRQAGVIGEVGVSNASLARWHAAEKALGSRVLSNQVGYSLVARGAERDLLPYARAQNRVIIAYRPLGLGLLSGEYPSASSRVNSIRATAPLFLPENLERATNLIAALREVAAAHSATPAQVALAWVIRHPAVAAIPGASSVEQIETNAAAADIELANDEYAALQAASAEFRPLPGPSFPTRQIVRPVRSLAARWRNHIRARLQQ